MLDLNIILSIIILLILLILLLSQSYYKNKMSTLQKNLAKIKSDKISLSTKYGQISEEFFPLEQSYPYNSKDFKFLGKTPGKDKKQGKSTLISVIGEEKAIKFCLHEIKQFEYKNKKYFNQYKILTEVLSMNLKKYK